MKTSVNKTSIIGPAVPDEQFIAEHLFFYLDKGIVSGFYGDKSYTLHPGKCGVVRKNRLSRQDNTIYNGEVEKMIFVFDEPFLRTFQEKHSLKPVRFLSAESFIQMENESLISGFIHSLKPYYNELGQIDQAFFNIKREELLLILLHLQPDLTGVFFDYAAPQKINLEVFMNQHYRFNVSIQRFALLTGRSLSAFKRDFHAIFNQTPSRWLVEKRLQEAYFLIDKKRQQPSNIYLDLGFETLSHFSFAFKNLFGQTPTDLASKREKHN